MGEGKQNSSAVSILNSSEFPISNSNSNSSPLLQIQSKFKELETGLECWVSKQPVGKIHSKWKELENGLECWVSKQPLYIEAAVSTARGAAQGALFGAILATARQALSPVPPVRPLFGVSMCDVKVGVVDACFTTVSKRLRRKEDELSQTFGRLVDEFRYGAVFSFACYMHQPVSIQVENMFVIGLVPLMCLECYHSLRRPGPDDPSYMKTKRLLKELGMDKYIRHFSFGMLNDDTLPLVTNSVLKEAGIPRDQDSSSSTTFEGTRSLVRREKKSSNGLNFKTDFA